ncbi:phosphoribosylanthranilate isomerase, partial [Clostridium butyricum]
MKIKICGITCEKEIEYLNILKPDYIGFVFTKSKRQISAFDAKLLRKKLNPEIKCVGVFKDNSLIEINNVLKKVNLDVVQLHGSENFDFINLLKKNENHKFEIWKALSINNKIFLNEYVSYYMRMKNNCVMDNILID